MEGGIRAWQGMVATGGPEAGMAYFTAAEKLEDLVILAWGLEEGTSRFYHGVMERLADAPETGRLLSSLIDAENHHQQMLLTAFKRLVGREASSEELQAGYGENAAGEIMEGGVRVREALEWTRDQEIRSIIELAMGLEINSYDLYIKMSRRVEEDEGRLIFRNLALEEQDHLERLGSLLNERLRSSAHIRI